MSWLESIFYMIWRGIAIGVLISAPMGPVGILCIQRTLDKGRKTGLYTGVGAAISDLLYCLLTGFGLSFIEEFLERNSSIIQLIGSVVLIAFGVYLFKKNPARTLKKPVGEQAGASPKQNILTGFLFTFSNPLIIFLIIGLFARFNFLMPDIRIHHYIVGYAGIVIGALGWWWVVTFFVDKVRAHFNLRSMWLINRIIGIIILCFALVGIISASIALANGTPANAADPPALRLSAAVDPHGRPWQLHLLSEQDTLAEIRFSQVEIHDPISSTSALKADFLSSSVIRPVSVNISPALTRFAVSVSDTVASLHMGVHSPEHILDFPIPNGARISGFAASLADGTRLELRDSLLSRSDAFRVQARRSPWSDSDLLADYLSRSEDILEGYWHPLDMALEERLLRLGGDYRFALVRSEDGYDLIYLEGARTAASRWRPGMVKAELRPSGTMGVWRTVWYDAEGLPLSRNVTAFPDSPSTLTLQFPYQNSTLRISRTD